MELFVEFTGQILDRWFFDTWERSVTADFGIAISANVLNAKHGILCATRLDRMFYRP